jgi:hypothetical protein
MFISLGHRKFKSYYNTWALSPVHGHGDLMSPKGKCNNALERSVLMGL